jgi:hypothetical protein
MLSAEINQHWGQCLRADGVAKRAGVEIFEAHSRNEIERRPPRIGVVGAHQHIAPDIAI